MRRTLAFRTHRDSRAKHWPRVIVGAVASSLCLIALIFVHFRALPTLGARIHGYESVMPWVVDSCLYLFVEALLVLVLVPGMVAAACLREVDPGSRALLRGSLRERLWVVLRKLGAVFLMLAPLGGAYLAGAAFFLFNVRLQPYYYRFSEVVPTYANLVLGIFLCFFYVTAVSFFVASRCRHYWRAMVAVYAVNVALLVLQVPLVLLLDRGIHIEEALGYDALCVILTWGSPIMAQLFALLMDEWKADFDTYWILNSLFIGTVACLLMLWGTHAYARRAAPCGE